MRQISNFVALVLIGFAVSNCTDVVDIEISEVPPQLVVDAWLTNNSEPQVIRLTMSQQYFDSSFPPVVDDAVVGIVDADGRIFEFTYEGNGDYVWTPAPGESFGQIGQEFFLGIEWEGNTFASQTTLNRVPQIDSIVSEFREEDLFGPEGYYAQFYARDVPGFGDAYWIKTFKNDTFLNKPFELNIAFDAAFAPGAQTDGLVFIPPIRELVNRVPDPEGPDDADVPPYDVGDTIRVEIHSITPLAFEFLRIARDQMNNGANTIFALPIANPQSNIVAVEGDEEAVGFFNIAAVSSLEHVVEEE